MGSTATNLEPRTTDVFRSVQKRLEEIVATTPERVEALMIGVLAGGHVLIEGVPGIGKTLLARSLARAFACDFKRIQFTNDLMPSDVIGSSIWRPENGRLEFQHGPLFADLVLADEINRTSPRTLSCLLEAMESGRVSVDGKTMRLGEPFVVLATRNPIEFHGTQPMPEAALDRFMLRISLGYPDDAREIALYVDGATNVAEEESPPLLTKPELLSVMRQVQGIQVHYPVAAYGHAIVQASRKHEGLALGASPRAALSWFTAGRARALLHGRKYVLPDDLKALLEPALAHRVHARDGASASEILREIAARTPVPV